MTMAIIGDEEALPVAQFRVEFVLDQSSGKYLAELYSPDHQQELIARTEAMYASQAAAVLGLVQLFKDAILPVPQQGTPPAKPAARKAKKKSASGRRGRRKHH
jgi:hypothetical protein